MCIFFTVCIPVSLKVVKILPFNSSTGSCVVVGSCPTHTHTHRQHHTGEQEQQSTDFKNVLYTKKMQI